MINKNFRQITYSNTFQSFEFIDSGADKPYNAGWGSNLVVTKNPTNETVPILGPHAPMEITQTVDISTKTGFQWFVQNPIVFFFSEQIR
jgi:hypothetical protein